LLANCSAQTIAKLVGVDWEVFAATSAEVPILHPDQLQFLSAVHLDAEELAGSDLERLVTRSADGLTPRRLHAQNTLFLDHRTLRFPRKIWVRIVRLPRFELSKASGLMTCKGGSGRWSTRDPKRIEGSVPAQRCV
jgi:hypothetical protein